ncbi:alpha/beta hydrolase family protein [Agrobacterium tumefaciens]|jgi:dienelactone hydrolase|uniref:Dienelactone hydrolase n=1 Tax=Agrobacterium tumefaciens TaxID=358 RepID=A0AAW8M073_AGRTU|nr:alpha/beta hydrolase [Agrobacterium tumefaciens]MBP2542192.1 dienelactone hydrolase [Agrobacterium tumefaciens]MBP2568100.1 dienelactone hydrolase [Agrobacterium tumefaciens]MDP9874208.1 dienelactone hydrolase [Agrobacterium tumefaciens]MDP9978804.1 dienelactone hydrolase [Agrobacterium tumefaciens]MDR6704803.1 dienelactone hydrolase [Agrobacterium tumefaciens]
MSREEPRFAWWIVRWALLALAIPGASQSALADAPRLGPFELPKPRELTIFRDDQAFNPFEALNGSYATAASCATVPHGLWIDIDGKGDCIRYYPQALAEGENRTVLVYFGGDVMLRNSKGVRFITDSYLRQSPATIAAEMADWARQAGRPAIFMARPGIYGSSGDHNKRRHPREIVLMDRALDQIKQEHKISTFILVGHSAGGQIVAGLLSRRSDVSAAVISSGLVSVKQVSAYWERRRRVSGKLLYNAAEFYDPVDEIDRIPTAHRPDIYVLSNPEDRTVPFFSQLLYVRRLRVAGFEPHHIYVQATDRQRHLLAYHGSTSNVPERETKSWPWCAGGQARLMSHN